MKFSLFPVVLVVLVALGAAVAHRRRGRDKRRIVFWRGFIDRNTGYRIDDCLGLGREGVVFRVHTSEGDAAPRALKIMDACDAKERDEHLDLLCRIERARTEAALADWPSLPRIYECGVLRAEGREVAFEVIEFIDGETLRAALASGSVREWTLDERLKALDELLAGLEVLRLQGLTFVHIDLDNVMLGADRHLKLIDLAGFQTRRLTPQLCRRTFRRQARTILGLLDDQWPGLLSDKRYPGAIELVELLSLYKDLPKDVSPPAGIELLTFEDLRLRIATCLPRALEPRPADSADSGLVSQG
jgi:serine/threonine protein kinase